MRNSLVALAVLALVPAYAGAQVAGTSPAVSVGSAPRGPDTPVTTVPGTVRAEPPNVNRPLPSVDSSGANRSSDMSTTGEARAPIGAPRLPGEPSIRRPDPTTSLERRKKRKQGGQASAALFVCAPRAYLRAGAAGLTRADFRRMSPVAAMVQTAAGSSIRRTSVSVMNSR